MSEKAVFFARNLADTLSHLHSTQEFRVMAGCTLDSKLPPHSLCVRPKADDELMVIDRRERYIELGSAVTLSTILSITKRRLSPVFFEAVESIAVPFVRNLATIGGNICALGRPRTLFPVLLALDARLEFRSQNETLFIPIGKFTTVPSGMILTKIRLPIFDWEVNIFKRLGPPRIFTENSASFVFLAMTEKGILSDLRIAYSNDTVYRSRELENRLIGTRLPLSKKTMFSLLDETAERFENSELDTSEHLLIESPSGVKQFLDLLEFSLGQLM
jgi:CO/xanthine dehydrogenase FAD-binding subunit